MTGLVVRPHRPWLTRLLLVLAALALAAAGWSLFEYGSYRAGFDRVAGERERQALLDERRALQAQIAELREHNAVLARASQVDRQARAVLSETLRTLQDEILELKQELTFYRGIVSPRGTARGLTLQSFEIQPHPEAGRYRFKLVLTQVLNNDSLARGAVRLSVEGTQQGRQRTLDLEEISANQVKELAYRFKYFQNLEGELVIPEAFLPARVLLEVKPRGRSADTIEKAFDWPAEETEDHVGQEFEETRQDRHPDWTADGAAR